MLHDRWNGHGCRYSRCLTTAPVVHRTALPDPLPAEIELVLFDLGGVLYDDSAWRRWLLHLLGHMGLHTQYTPFFRVWDRDYAHDVAWGDTSDWEAMRLFLLSAGLSPGQVDEVAAAGRSRIRDFELNIRPYPRVRETLQLLAVRGCDLGILSSAPLTADQMANKLARLRLSAPFRTVRSAGDWPRPTPPQQWLRAILDSEELPAACVAYVGRLKEPLEAARDVGLHTIAYNPEPDASAPTRLEQFDQLPALIPDSAAPALRVSRVA
jgi:FMN phosphatase YigB (HAD superfamily)